VSTAIVPPPARRFPAGTHLHSPRGAAIPFRMDTSTNTTIGNDRRRVLRAFNLSLGFVLLLVAMFAAQQTHWDWRPLAVAPHALAGLWGLLGAPLLHGSVEHP